jgi:phosphate starvation-inducible PhoH-like protein
MAKRKQPATQADQEEHIPPPRRSKLNQSQQRAWELMQEHPVVCLVGPAGTGKSHCAIEHAATAVRQRKYEKIVFVRSPVEMGRSRLGFIPGEVKDKMAPYMAPLLAIAKKFGVKPDAVECYPTGFVQGMTFEKSIVIVDEVQNLDIEEFRAIVTRLGVGSQMILAGDPAQDTRRIGSFSLFLDRMQSCKSVGIQYFSESDNMRNPVIIEVLKALEGA